MLGLENSGLWHVGFLPEHASGPTNSAFRRGFTARSSTSSCRVRAWEPIGPAPASSRDPLPHRDATQVASVSRCFSPQVVRVLAPSAAPWSPSTPSHLPGGAGSAGGVRGLRRALRGARATAAGPCEPGRRNAS